MLIQCFNTAADRDEHPSPVCHVCDVHDASVTSSQSFGEVIHLMQFEQKVVRDVKCGKANSHSNGSFNPVHA